MCRYIYLFRCLIVAVFLATAAFPQVLRGEITEVVLTGTTGRFTHSFELGSEETKGIPLNRKEGVDADFLKTVSLAPHAQLMVQKPDAAPQPNTLQLFPDVFKLGEGGSDDFDLNLDAFWRHLLGEEIALTVRDEVADDQERHAEAVLRRAPVSTTTVSGRLIAIPKTRTPGTPYLLKIVREDPGSNEQEIISVSEGALVKINCRGKTIGDLQEIIRYFENRSQIDDRVFSVFNSGANRITASVSYDLDSKKPWNVYLYGTLDRELAAAPQKMAIRGVAEITNETLTAWQNAKVTLKGADDEIILTGINLLPGATGRFEISSLNREIPSLTYGPSDEMPSLRLTEDVRELDVTTHFEIAAPGTEVVEKVELPMLQVLVLENRTDVKIPGGKLIVYESEAARRRTGVVGASAVIKPLAPMPRGATQKPASAKVTTNLKTNVVAKFTRSAVGQPLRPLAIDSYRLAYETGVTSTYEFSVAGTNPYKSLLVEVDSKQSTPPVRTMAVTFEQSDGSKVGLVKLVPKVAKEWAINRASVHPGKAPQLRLHEVSQRSVDSVALVDASAPFLKARIENAIGFPNSSEVKAYLEGLLTLRAALDQQQILLAKRVDELQAIQQRRESYLFQPASKYHGPIDRHWTNEVQQKEMAVAAQRAVVAEAEFLLDAYLENTERPPGTAETGWLDFEDLGGFLEWEDGQPMLASLGGGALAASVTDDQLSKVRKPEDLRQLSLRGCHNVTTLGMRWVMGLAGLEHLNLSGTRIDDKALALLPHLSELRDVDVRNTLVTFDGVRRLQRQMPHCRVQHDADLQSGSLPARRWIFALTNLTKKTTKVRCPDGKKCEPPQLGLDDLLEVMKQASELDYNGVVVQDYYLGFRSEHIPLQLIDHLTQLRQAADELDMEVIPTIIPIGNSESVLNNPQDVRLAEGLPVVQALFQVKEDHASIRASEHIRGGDFESPELAQALGPWLANVDHVEEDLTQDEFLSGKQSLELVHTLGSHWRLSQQVENLKPWHQYRIRFSVKTKGFQIQPEKTGLQFYVFGGAEEQPTHRSLLTKWELNHKGDAIRERESVNVSVYSQQPWTTYEFVVNTVTYDALRLDLEVSGAAAGTLWMDDISVQELGGYDLIRRDGCPLTVTDITESTTYKEGKDFVSWKDPRADTGTHEPPAIMLTDNSQIKKDGIEHLLVSYYHCYRREPASLASCLRHRDLHTIYAQQIRILQGVLRPQTWLMDYDELRLAGHCALCNRRADETVGDVLAENVRLCTGLLRAIDPDAEIRVWNDMFDPHHNAVPATHEHSYYPWVASSLDQSWKGLGDDVRVVNWSGKVESIKFFAELPRRQLIASYYDDEWKEQLRASFKAGQQSPATAIDGVMYSTYERDYSALNEFMDLVKQDWPHK